MSLGRRILRASALARASLALIGTSGTYFSMPLLPLAVIAQQTPEKKEAKRVAINILVIEADEKGSSIDERLKDPKLLKAMRGYSGAKVLDELNTTAEEGSSVSLEIMRQSSPQLLKVTVRKVEPDGKVKLRVVVDALKISTDTTHEKSGDMFVIAKDRGGNKALFLAIIPKI